MEVVQQWLGTVLDIQEDCATINLENLTNPDLPDEVVLFLKSDLLSRSPKPFNLVAGASFNWRIIKDRGSKIHSTIHFRESPRWKRLEASDVDQQSPADIERVFFN